MIHITKMKTKTDGPHSAGSGVRLTSKSDRQPDETDPSEHDAADNELRKALHDGPRHVPASAQPSSSNSDDTLFNW